MPLASCIAVIVAEPAPTIVNIPLLIVATLGLSLVKLHTPGDVEFGAVKAKGLLP
jgi:hypothetical protein